jgi:hypothetical protein
MLAVVLACLKCWSPHLLLALITLYLTLIVTTPLPLVATGNNKDAGTAISKVPQYSWSSPFPVVANHVDKSRDMWATCMPSGCEDNSNVTSAQVIARRLLYVSISFICYVLNHVMPCSVLIMPKHLRELSLTALACTASVQIACFRVS